MAVYDCTIGRKDSDVFGDYFVVLIRKKRRLLLRAKRLVLTMLTFVSISTTNLLCFSLC